MTQRKITGAQIDLTTIPNGTVTTVSVVTANGFAGSVATATTTPAITLTTSITGVLKGNGTAISAATSGTDYSAGTSALATGILKSTTTTGALTIAVAGDFPTLNQNTTGSAATLTTPRAINGTNFDGSAAITVTAAAGTLTGTTLNATVVTSSLTSVGTITSGTWNGTAVDATHGGTAQTAWATGDLLYASGSNTLAKRTIGSTNDVLTVVGGVPAWAAPTTPTIVWAAPSATLPTPQTNNATSGVLALASGRGDTNVIQSSGTTTGGFYVGSGITTTGTTTDNVVIHNAAATTNDLTLNGVLSSVFIDPSGVSGTTTITNDNFIHIGARNNTTQPGDASTCIGAQARATAGNAIAIGQGTLATATNAIRIGNGGTATGTTSFSVGNGNNANGVNAIAILGSNASPDGSIAIGGSANVASSQINAIAFGTSATPDSASELSYAGGVFSTAGDASASIVKHWMTTTNATPTEVGGGATSATPTSKVILANASAYLFDCHIVARQNTTGDTSAWTLSFLIKRGANAAATSLFGTPAAVLVAQDTGALTWAVAVTADTTNGRPSIKVTGEAAKTIRWIVNMRVTKVSG